MKVLVTGGNGFIGSVVVRTLIAEGYSVRCLVRDTSNTDRIDDLDWERAEGDVRHTSVVAAAVAGCEAVIHLASLSSWKDIDSPLMNEVVETGTRNVLAAARGQPGTRVVFVSSVLAVNGSEQPQPFDENAVFDLPDRKLKYSRCKRKAEAMCLEAAGSGVPVVIVNPTEVYGPHDTAMITAGNLVDFANSKPVLVCRGGTSVAYVDDVALAIVRAMERGRSGERYILGGENLSVKALAQLCLDILGKKQSIVTVPNPIIKALAALGLALHIPLPFEPRVIPYATKYWFVDSGKASRELGVTFRPARKALEPTLGWLKASGHIA
jgi:dihydroflavonol-4-reductase